MTRSGWGRATLLRVVATGVFLAWSLPFWPVGVAVARTTRETEPLNPVTSCGVERWDVKTGMDADAHLVRQAAAVTTTILQLRAFSAPGTPPLHRRVRPVETTAWALDATLLRYKQEMDADYHLVIADARGHTMIAELPAPACVGGTSPFLPAIRAVRRAFTAQFRPTLFWQRLHLKVHLVGVGFFDFLHGQSGVAPNAIELHPVLGIWWSGAPVETGAPSAPAPAVGANLRVQVRVTPNPTASGTSTTVSAVTAPGAACTVAVRYPSGHVSTSAALATSQTADTRGQVAWTWQPRTRITGTGLATVHCARGATEGRGTAAFALQ